MDLWVRAYPTDKSPSGYRLAYIDDSGSWKSSFFSKEIKIDKAGKEYYVTKIDTAPTEYQSDYKKETKERVARPDAGKSEKVQEELIEEIGIDDLPF